MPVEIIRPSAVLAPFITDLRVITPAAGDAVMRVERLPDGSASLVFRRFDAAAALAPGAASAAAAGPAAIAVAATALPGDGARTDLCVSGVRRRALFKEVRPAPLTVAIRFKPGAAVPFFGVPASELSDRVVALDDLWRAPGEQLRESLAAAREPHDIVDALQHALHARIGTRAFAARETAAACLARRAVHLLISRDGDGETPPRMRDIARTLGVSDRHLRRAFDAAVGVSPKEFARMARLQRAVHAAAARSQSLPQAHTLRWTDIAAQAGYYDQAHMIAEFRELIGATPTAFLRHGVDRALRWASPACRAL
jgi:AraC-like DNA-binding protein